MSLHGQVDILLNFHIMLSFSFNFLFYFINSNPIFIFFFQLLWREFFYLMGVVTPNFDKMKVKQIIVKIRINLGTIISSEFFCDFII